MEQERERASIMFELAREAHDVYDKRRERAPNVVKDRNARLIVDSTEKQLRQALELIGRFYESERFSVTYFSTLQKLRTLLQGVSREFEKGFESDFEK